MMAYRCGVPRWEPDAPGRLEQAALELYRERGFDRTAAADIAARAGLSESTFFRHFTDKREVLFGGSDELQAMIVREVREAPPGTGPLDAIAAALCAAEALFEPRTELLQLRQTVISAHAALRERELIKLARLAGGLADALRQREVTGPDAVLAAETGMALFHVGYQRWIDRAGTQRFRDAITTTLTDLRCLTVAT